MLLTDNFELEEFVSKKVFETFGKECLRFLDSRLIVLLECIRGKVKSDLAINNWHVPEEVLKGINNKYLLDFDVDFREEENGFILPYETTDDQLIHQMSGRGMMIRAITLTSEELLQKLKDNFLQYRLYGLTRAKLIGKKVYLDVSCTKIDKVPNELIVL
jgi:hypothetical protein